VINKKYFIFVILILFVVTCTPIKRDDYLDHGQSENLYSIAMEEFQEGNYSDAVIIFREIERTYPHNEREYHVGYMLSLSFFRMENFQQSEIELKKLLSMHNIPEDLEISSTHLLAEVYQERGKSIDAARTYLNLHEMLDDQDYMSIVEEDFQQIIESISSDDQWNVYKMNRDHDLAPLIVYSASIQANLEGKSDIAQMYWDELLVKFPDSRYALGQPPIGREIVDNLIGVLLPLEGEWSNYGLEVLNGIRLGIKNTSLELKIYNTEGSVSLTRELAEKLIFEDGVIAIIGPLLSSTSYEIASICDQAGVTMITPTAMQEGISEAGEYIFQLNRKEESGGLDILANHACLEMGYRSFAIVYEEEFSSEAENFSQEARTYGGRIVGEWKFEKNTNNFSTIVDNIIEKEPEAVFITGNYQGIVQLTATLRFKGFEAQFFGSSQWDDDRIVRFGEDAVVGAIFVGKGSPLSGSEIMTFISSFTAEYGQEHPNVSRLGYDASRIIAMAYSSLSNIRSASELGDAIIQIKFYRGASGPIILATDENFTYNLRTIKRGRIIPLDE